MKGHKIMSFNEYKEHNVRAGLGTAFCIMKPNETKYHFEDINF